MSVSARTGSTPPATRAALSPAARAASAWLGQFSRTLKVCRLYDARNPTVVRFREELTGALRSLLDDHGAIELTFTSREILLGDDPIHSGESREDNLALPFFRDGVRRLTLAPGTDSREVNAILDAVLRVTHREADLEDLVTLLWDAELTHVGMEYVAPEGDAESGPGDAAAARAGGLAPWPRGDGGTAAGSDEPGRSDDLETGDVIGDVEAAYLEIEGRAAAETDRFRRAFARTESEIAAPRALTLLRECLASTAQAEDRGELARFLPRILHESLGDGAWTQSRETLALLREVHGAAWSPGPLVGHLCSDGSLTARHALAQLECQPCEAIEEFAAFARDLGPDGFDWVMRVIAASERQHVRRPLTRVAAELASGQPERLAPWLADERWYVVRNAVHILGWMGATAPASLLARAKDHPEPRVRREVVAAAAKHETPEARRMIVEMLPSSDGRLLVAVLQQLGKRRDPDVAKVLVGMLRSPAAADRQEAETRAIYLALAGVGGDAILPELEADILNGSWIAAGDEPRRFAAAMCASRIETPAALDLLERNARSRRANVARACREALASRRPPAAEREAA